MDSPQVKSDNIYYLNNGRIDHPLTILLVHGNVEVLSKWQALFSPFYHVEVALDGSSAARILLCNSIDFVISAISVPIISGFGLCRLMNNHDNERNIPFMFVSEFTDEQEEEKALILGAIDYLAADSSMTIFINRVKNHMTLIQENKKLEIDSTTDALTGLANRLSLDKKLDDALSHAKRGDYCVSLMMIDIDHFKAFNDTYGHVAGDQCLKKIAQVIQSFQKREQDLAARYGGEEFVLLLPYTDELGSQKLAAEMLTKIRQLNLTSGDNACESYVSVSIGLTTFNAKTKGKETLEASSIIELADGNLYRAKASGRNQYCY